MSSQLFVKSKRIKDAVAIINILDDSKFPLLLTRILQKLHLKEEIFTEEEQGKLEISLSISQEQLKLVLQALTFIFEQAAYHLTKPAVLTQQLQELELDEEKISAIVQAWVKHARNVTDKLKKKTIAPTQLTDINWQLRLQLAQSALSKQKSPVGVIDLTLDSSKGPEHLQMEFTHDELFSFYNQLEVVQSQLDALR